MRHIRKHVSKSSTMTRPTIQKDLEGRILRERHVKPFLKWAGGKSHLLPQLRSLVLKQYDKYIEPFLGGGALFLDLRPNHAVISDLNSELINCYIVVRDAPYELLEQLKGIPVNSKTYYRIRKRDPKKLNDIERAARLVYLNKTCYNGLYRVNKRGQFNTPYGKNDNARVYTPKNILRASKALRIADILQGDFEPILLNYASCGDFIYLDPPYPPTARYSDFTRYTSNFFYKKDHLRLAKVVEELDNRNCRFALSNAKHPLVLKIYSKYKKIEVKAPRYISSRGDGRGNVSEILITNISMEKEA